MALQAVEESASIGCDLAFILLNPLPLREAFLAHPTPPITRTFQDTEIRIADTALLMVVLSDVAKAPGDLQASGISRHIDGK